VALVWKQTASPDIKSATTDRDRSVVPTSTTPTPTNGNPLQQQQQQQQQQQVKELKLARNITLNGVYEASNRIYSVVQRTPLVRLFADGLPCDIYLKLETLQPIGSFKIRGAMNAASRVLAILPLSGK
jgi:hypothetical protein